MIHSGNTVKQILIRVWIVDTSNHQNTVMLIALLLGLLLVFTTNAVQNIIQIHTPMYVFM